MRTHHLPLLCLLVACGPSEVDVTEAEHAKTQADGAGATFVPAPTDLGEGLLLTVLQRGSGPFVSSGGRVRVHYSASVVAVAEPAPTDDVTAAADSASDAPAEAEAAPETATDADVPPSDEVDADAPPAEDVAPPVEPTEPASEPVESDAPPEPALDDAANAAVAPDLPAEPALPRRFDSSHARGVPDTWDLARTASPRLIEGLRRGLVGLTGGSRVELRVPAALAWGEEGLPHAGVPPHADVLYVIELIEVLQ